MAAWRFWKAILVVLESSVVSVGNEVCGKRPLPCWASRGNRIWDIGTVPDRANLAPFPVWEPSLTTFTCERTGTTKNTV